MAHPAPLLEVGRHDGFYTSSPSSPSCHHLPLWVEMAHPTALKTTHSHALSFSRGEPAFRLQAQVFSAYSHISVFIVLFPVLPFPSQL